MADYGARLEQFRYELDEVEAAMRRVEDGSYGRCETCSAPLPSGLLATSPMERACPSCRPPEASPRS